MALLVTHVSEHVLSYGRHSVIVNAAWALRFGHALSVDTRGREPGKDFRGAKVQIMIEHLENATSQNLEYGWVVWVDADAIFLNFEDDALRSTLLLT